MVNWLGKLKLKRGGLDIPETRALAMEKNLSTPCSEGGIGKDVANSVG